VRVPETQPRREQLSPLHSFWGQNGTAIAVGAGVLLASGTLSSMTAVWIDRLVLIAGLYGMFAAYLGLWLPEPRPETRGRWRTAVLVLFVAVLGAAAAQRPIADAWARRHAPEPVPPASPRPLLVMRPPLIEYQTPARGSPRIVVDIGLVNLMSRALRVSISSKAVLGPVTKDDAETSVLQGLRDDVQRQRAGVQSVFASIPAYDSSRRFVIRGPEVSRSQWSAFEAGREQVSYYALVRVQFGMATYFSISCGSVAGDDVRTCPLKP
jgi:hypothetical protein